MITEIVARYENNYDWPILKGSPDSANPERRAGDNYGDIECPFCDKVICNEGSVLRIGDKCWNCPAEVIRFENLKA